MTRSASPARSITRAPADPGGGDRRSRAAAGLRAGVLDATAAHARRARVPVARAQPGAGTGLHLRRRRSARRPAQPFGRAPGYPVFLALSAAGARRCRAVPTRGEDRAGDRRRDRRLADRTDRAAQRRGPRPASRPPLIAAVLSAARLDAGVRVQRDALLALALGLRPDAAAVRSRDQRRGRLGRARHA